MAKESFGYGFAAAANATRCFSSVPTAIAATAIAACIAAIKLGSVSGVAPTAATNKVQKDDSITAIGSAAIGNVVRKRA